MKRHTKIVGFATACFLGMATMLHSQALPTASRLGSIQVGAGWFFANPDFAQSHIQGMTFYSDINFPDNIGVEGEIHYSVITPSDVSENTYLLGPRYMVRHKRVEGYAKALFGPGHFGLQVGSNPYPQTDTYFVYVIGSGIDVHALPVTSTFEPSTSRCRSGRVFRASWPYPLGRLRRCRLCLPLIRPTSGVPYSHA